MSFVIQMLIHNCFCRVQNKSNFSRSKSFSGRPSYGVVFGTTAVKSKDHSQITAFQAPLPPARYSSSDLLKEKTRPDLAPADSWQSSTISLPVDVEFSSREVTTIHEEKNPPLELRLSRKSLGSMPMVSSTSSLETVGSFDRRQGPAPPPRRSESKLLSSFRLRGKRMHPHTVSVRSFPSSMSLVLHEQLGNFHRFQTACLFCQEESL